MTEPEPRAPQQGETVLLRVHRSPRIGRFVVSGGVLGVLIGVLATLMASPDSQSFRIGLSVCLVTGLIGSLLGGALALAADRRRRPRDP